jgi:hypothetical protein
MIINFGNSWLTTIGMSVKEADKCIQEIRHYCNQRETAIEN